MIPIGLIAGIAAGAGQMAYGASLQNKARRAAEANVRPEYQINPEEQLMYAQAQSMAGQGMSDASRTAYQNNINNTLGTGINAALRSGANPNAIGSMVSKATNAANNIAIYDDEARLKNLANLQSARARMSANRDKEWQINRYNPYADRAQAIAQQMAGANNIFMSGMNTLQQGALGAISNTDFQRQPRSNYRPPAQNISQLPMYGTPAYAPQPVQVPGYQPSFNNGVDSELTNSPLGAEMLPTGGYWWDV